MHTDLLSYRVSYEYLYLDLYIVDSSLVAITPLNCTDPR